MLYLFFLHLFVVLLVELILKKEGLEDFEHGNSSSSAFTLQLLSYNAFAKSCFFWFWSNRISVENRISVKTGLKSWTTPSIQRITRKVQHERVGLYSCAVSVFVVVLLIELILKQARKI